LGEPVRLSYGPAEIEKIEVYKTNRPNAPVNVYVHGGAWRGGRARQNAYMAETFVKAARISRRWISTMSAKPAAISSDGRAMPARGGVGVSERGELRR
jgi:arylformamidase